MTELNHRLADALVQLLYDAGNPSSRAIAGDGQEYSHTTVSQVLNGDVRTIAALKFVVERLGGDVEDYLPLVGELPLRRGQKNPRKIDKTKRSPSLFEEMLGELRITNELLRQTLNTVNSLATQTECH